MYKVNMKECKNVKLSFNPYTFLSWLLKRWYCIRKPPPTFPMLYTVYKSVTNVLPFPNTTLFINLQLHRKGERK